jgi:hypothetical protein
MSYPSKNETDTKIMKSDVIKSIRKFSDDIYGGNIISNEKDEFSFDKIQSTFPRRYSLRDVSEHQGVDNIVLNIEEGIQYKIKANKLFKQNNYLESIKYYQKVSSL